METQWARRDKEDILLFVYAKPRANQSKIVGIREGELEVALRAPPVDGKANDELIQFLSKRLQVPKRALSLERGQASRHKVVRCTGAGLDAVREQLLPR